MNRPRLLDLFCGAGGAAMGYYRAGFDVVGVDIKPQPRYPFPFVKSDALEYVAAHGREFDAIHASPPCQAYSRATMRHPEKVKRHPDLVEAVRALLVSIGRPWVIENVPGAPLKSPVMLCGSMFGLGVWRHRMFENGPAFAPAACRHDFAPVPVYGHSGAGVNRGRERARGRSNTGADWRRAMGIDWMTNAELAEAIPPAYTEYIGRFLREAI